MIEEVIVERWREMPTIRLFHEDIERLTGVDIDTVREKLPFLGADLERDGEDFTDVEFFPNRPDLFSVEGVARALRAFLNIQPGISSYETTPSGIEMNVDDAVIDVRPYVVCGVVRDLEFDERAIESLMNLQEHIHRGIGRNRRKVSIGVHDLSKVKPDFRYTAVDPDFSFVPLDFKEKMTMKDILERHPKGIEYGFILKNADRYPLIVDYDGNVLSFPPIINAELTRVTEETRDLFIEVTGTDENVFVALNIVVCALAERGGRVQTVKVRSPQDGAVIETPDLNPSTHELRLSEVRALTGLDIDAETSVKCCARMGLHADVVRGDGSDGDDVLIVKVPAYRCDILHPWDIIEDIAIGYGYDRIVPTLPKTDVVGEENAEERRNRRIREMMIGLGFMEVQTFTLSSERKQFTLMRRRSCEVVRVAHPISEEYEMLRCAIMPNLIDVLSMNKHREMPQRIFEIGTVFRGEERTNLAAVSMHAHANFAEIRSVVDAILREFGIADITVIKPSDDDAFIKGRRASIMLNGREIGVFGEIHPEVIRNFSLDHPITGVEMDVDAINARPPSQRRRCLC